MGQCLSVLPRDVEPGGEKRVPSNPSRELPIPFRQLGWHFPRQARYGESLCASSTCQVLTCHGTPCHGLAGLRWLVGVMRSRCNVGTRIRLMSDAMDGFDGFDGFDGPLEDDDHWGLPFFSSSTTYRYPPFFSLYFLNLFSARLLGPRQTDIKIWYRSRTLRHSRHLGAKPNRQECRGSRAGQDRACHAMRNV